MQDFILTLIVLLMWAALLGIGFASLWLFLEVCSRLERKMPEDRYKITEPRELWHLSHSPRN